MADSLAFVAAARAALVALLGQVPYLPAAEVAAFAAAWARPVALGRGDFLVLPGQPAPCLYLVERGLLRIFYPTATEEISVGFGHAGELLCAFPAFVGGEASEYGIQALRPSKLLGISRQVFMAFLDQHPAFARFWRQELERALAGRMTHELDLLLPDPAQRLARLRQRSPHIFRVVPKKYLASYLRMSPETLSRLR